MPHDATPIEPTRSARIQKQELELARKEVYVQENSEMAMIQFADEAAFNPVTLSKRFETLEQKIKKKEVGKKETESSVEKIEQIEEVEEISKTFERRNPELTARALQGLLAQIREDDSAEEILGKAMRNFPDHYLADEALEFLELTTKQGLLAKAKAAKQSLNANYGREVRAGRNINQEAQAFSKQGLASPSGLRDIYREITGNPRDAASLFSHLNDKFTYDKMKVAIAFFLHSLGADLKSKGPSIAPGELHKLMTEARNLLAILWVYRFFKGRMDLISSSFEKSGMLLPPRITFEMLAKMFVQFLTERYPSMDKVFQLALKMGISAELLAQVILFTQMRDAVRGVAPKLFRHEQHRHDVLMSFIEALEELEENLEDKEEEEEEQPEEDNEKT